jgi:hypothetical protein
MAPRTPERSGSKQSSSFDDSISERNSTLVIRINRRDSGILLNRCVGVAQRAVAGWTKSDGTLGAFRRRFRARVGFDLSNPQLAGMIGVRVNTFQSGYQPALLNGHEQSLGSLVRLVTFSLCIDKT